MSEVELMKSQPRVWKIIISLAALLAVFVLTGFLTMRFQYAAMDPKDKTAVDVIVPDKSSAVQVAAFLRDKGLVHSQLAFRIYCSQNHLASSLKPGHYRFYRSQSLAEIAAQISQGKVVSTTFTVPEGYTVEQIGRLLVDKKLVSAADWQAALKSDYAFSFLPPAGGKREQRLEGFLFPDTYNIEEKTSARQIIQLMLERFNSVWSNGMAQEAQQQKKSPLEVVTVASLIEREAKVAAEREIISGVIKNRLSIHMALQMCPTVLYALKQEKDILSLADLKIESPYNTYKYPGLPPGPIACPGRASLQAALHPQQHSYFYYVSKGDGTHYFSKTFAEHAAAVKKYEK
ncbi:MAG TPA: endolytic transglycosylase MltG [Syntrophomonadaceae bacterium]|nr:endolytic transglycosylase MltG [Syntrophomonadaceae bacterium]